MIANDLRRISKLYIKTLGQYLPAPHSEFMAETMLLVADRKHPVTVETLIKYLENDKRTIVKSLEELIKMGYLDIRKVSAIRSESRLFLTASGNALVPEIRQAVEITENKMAGKLEKVDLQRFYADLKTIEDNLENRF